MDAMEIQFELRRRGIQQQAIAEQADVTPATVSKALYGKIPGRDVWPVLIELLGYDPRTVEKPPAAAS